MKRIMAVYDVDPGYADRFAEFVNRRETVPFTAVAFTSMERMKAFAKHESVELLLLGEGVTQEQLGELKEIPVVRLSGGAAGVGEQPVVYKYQASDSVLREVMACYQAGNRDVPLTATGLKSRIIGVYSPVSRCGKTSFAITLGQMLAREEKVLMLSLEQFSGLAELTHSQYARTLSDLIYYFRQGDYSRLKLGSVVYNLGELDYVPPVAYAEDLEEIRSEDITGLLDQISLSGMYRAILVDLGHYSRGLNEILSRCDVIYTPICDDPVSAARLNEWKFYLSVSGQTGLWEKVRILKLPRSRAVEGTGDYAEELLWGEMGDFVRNELE